MNYKNSEKKNFLPNDLYLSNICGITIDLGKRKEKSNLRFCQKGYAFPNKKHNNKTELYYIFSSQIQINLFDLCEYLFIDTIFKTATKGFYQVLNIIGFITNTGNSFPLMTIPMTSKTFIHQ